MANPIAPIEALAVLVALAGWEARIQGRSVLAFVDNEGVRACMVSGGSTSAAVAGVVGAAVDREIAAGALVWFERVPSESNLADPPSRGLRPPPLVDWSAPCSDRRTCMMCPALQVWGFRGGPDSMGPDRPL